MFRKKLKIIFITIFTAISLVSCSAQASVVKKIKTVSRPDSLKIKQNAERYFIQGAVDEVKEKYAEAILEYQEALRYSKSAGIYYALGKAYTKLNKLFLALQNTKQAVKLDSNQIDYNVLLAQIYQLSNNNDSAETVYKKIIRLDSNYVNAYYNLGLLYENKRPTDALSIYNKLLKITGQNWDVLLKIAEINDRLGNVKATIKTVERLTKLNPSSLNLQKLLIKSYTKIKEYDKALNLLNQNLIIYPDNLNLIELKANLFVHKGNWGKAADEYKILIKSNKIPFKSKLQIGTAFLAAATKDTNIRPIAKDILQTINKDSSDWHLNVYLGELAVQQKDDSSAVIYYQKAALQAPWNSEIWNRLGERLFTMGKYDKVISEIGKTIKNFPDNFFMNLILGLAYSQRNKQKEAEAYLLKAVELNPDDINALSAYGYTLDRLKKDDAALVYLDRAIKIAPNNIQILGMLGLIYDTKKMYDKSDYNYKKALSIDSTNALILNNYAYTLSERGIELKKALKMVQSAVKQEPDNSSYLDTYGWVYYKLKKYDKAIKYIKKSLKVDGKNSTVLNHLGDVYFKLGDKKNALKFWKSALKYDKKNKKIEKKIEDNS